MLNTKVRSGSLPGVVFLVLAAGFNLVSCGGGTTGGNESEIPPAGPVTVTLTSESDSIPYNSSTTLTWTSTNSLLCLSSGGGGRGATGSFNTDALTATRVYTLSCYNSKTGLYAVDSKTITVAPAGITGFADATPGSSVTVTSPNDLTNGAEITISGTTNYNGGPYTVTNATPTSFTIAPAVFAGDDATGTWQLAGGMISGCSSTGAIGAITLKNFPSRFHGVAPLSVFFDTTGTQATFDTPVATGTTATATTHPFHELEYRWNFGDPLGSPVSGTTWSYGSRSGSSSRNTATGPVAAHVFERPGVYTVAVTATDGTNTVSNSCAQIVVQDPDVVFAGNKTTCVGATSLPVQNVGGCPAGATAVQQPDFVTAISTYALTGSRVLFKRGDTFTSTAQANLVNTGPGIVGAFGTGAKPQINHTGNTTALGFSTAAAGNAAPGFSDWRVMDLSLDGGGTSQSNGMGISSGNGGVRQLTILRVDLARFNNGFGVAADGLNYGNNADGRIHTIDQFAIVDSTTTNGPNTSYAGYNAGNRVSFMGNSFENGGLLLRYDELGNLLGAGTHVLRFPFLNLAVISNNDILNPGGTRLCIKLHAPFRRQVPGNPNGAVGTPNKDNPELEHDANKQLLPSLTGTANYGWSNYSEAMNSDGYSKYVVISDNNFASNTPWQISLGPQDALHDERVKDVILERNHHTGGALTQVAQIIMAREITSRNNIFDVHGGYTTFAQVAVDAVEPPASNVWIFNNTVYKASGTGNSSDYFTIVRLPHTPVSNVTIRNNLGYAPTLTGSTPYVDAGITGLTAANNSTAAQINGTSPMFTAIPPSQITDWTPTCTGTTYPCGQGTAVPVWSDFFLNSRAQGVIDIGAVERP